METLENFKKYQTNHCQLFLCSTISENKIFDLNVSDYHWQLYFSKFYNYTFTTKNIKLYQYNNNYLYLDKNNSENNIHITDYDREVPLLKIDNFVAKFTQRSENNQSTFSNKRIYNIEEMKIIEVKINDDINIQFISNPKNSIKINIKLNHNIDNNIIVLKKILSNFC